MDEALSDTSEFQFTLPRGERLALTGGTLRGNVFQFTLPRGERPEI